MAHRTLGHAAHNHPPLVLCRSDKGDGGWSLHAPDATDADIASGDAPALAWGPAERARAGHWNRPNALDYRYARAALDCWNRRAR